MSDQQAEPNGTVKFRLDFLEREQTRQRDRIHDVLNELAATRLELQHVADEVKHQSEDVQALKRAFYTFAIGTVGSAIIFAFTTFALLGPK